jgi:Ser/Thr protein kinase RdoA (MazF antagonist)
LLIDVQELELVERSFGLRAGGWEVVSQGAVHTLYLQRASSVIVRLSMGRTLSHIEEEIRLTASLRRHGFALVPRFIRTGAGGWVAQLADGRLASAYEYVAGVVNQPLSQTQFEGAVDQVGRLTLVMGQLDPGEYGRPRFPDPKTAVERARILLASLEGPLELRRLLDNPDWPPALRGWDQPGLIHGDLHAGNFVWGPDGALLSILDFERFWTGPPLFEVAAFVTGTCFVDDTLDMVRVERAIDVLAAGEPLRQLLAGQLSDLLLVTALYFFGRVNRDLLRLPVVSWTERITWRDAHRAATLEQSRRDMAALASRMIQL